MATFTAVTETEFVEEIFATADRHGIKTRINKNGDRQIDFDNKSLTEDHVRRVFQDIVGKMGEYSRDDMDTLLGGSRPCAIAPFFDLATKAGLALRSEQDRKAVYRFKLSNRVS
jgi:hypothetical protein